MKARAFLAALFLVIGAGVPARAYVCTRVPSGGPSVAWQARNITYFINEGCSGEEDPVACVAAVERGFSAWTDVDCSDFTFVNGGLTTEARAGFDWRRPEANINVVVFREGTDDPVDNWGHQASALAITTLTFNSSTGRILDADVEINSVPSGTGREYRFQACPDDDPGACDRIDIQNTITHEAGHVVGLDHPPPDTPEALDATMYASAQPGEVKKRSLERDDQDGICRIYPLGGDNDPCFPAQAAATPPRFRQVRVCDDTGMNPCDGCQGPQFVGLGAGAFFFGLSRRRRRP